MLSCRLSEAGALSLYGEIRTLERRRPRSKADELGCEDAPSCSSATSPGSLDWRGVAAGIRDRLRGKTMDLQAINTQIATAVAGAPSTSPASSAGASDFASSLDAALKVVSNDQDQASEMARQFALQNPNVGLEDAVVAMSKANISFAAAVQVRNKLVQAYDQIMNMQV